MGIGILDEDNPHVSAAASWRQRSRGPQRADLAENGSETVAFDLRIVAALQIQPEPLRGAEIAGQPQAGVRADAPLTCTISSIQRGGTPMLTASLCWVIPNGASRKDKSTVRIHPWTRSQSPATPVSA